MNGIPWLEIEMALVPIVSMMVGIMVWLFRQASRLGLVEREQMHLKEQTSASVAQMCKLIEDNAAERKRRDEQIFQQLQALDRKLYHVMGQLKIDPVD